MANPFDLSSKDHSRVTAAVAEAELSTDCEIVTIINRQSDDYHDVALYFAAAAMMLMGLVLALFPHWITGLLSLFDGGWNRVAPGPVASIVSLVIVQCIAFFVVRYGMGLGRIRIALAPTAVKSRRVRQRAVQFFKASAEKRTAAREGVLLYLSVDERRAEIIADEAIVEKVGPELWGDAMAALIDHVRDGKTAEGMAVAVGKMGQVLATQFPKTEDDTNELPDRLIQL